MTNKKVNLLIAMVIIVAFVFTGCTTDSIKQIGEAIEKSSVFGISETAELDTMNVTANEIKESKGTQFFKPDDGNVFVGVKFTIENTSDEEVNVSSLLLFSAYADDVKCDYSINAACAFDDGTLDGTLAPGKKLVGWYALEVPKDWNEIEIQFKDDWISSSTPASFLFNKE